MAHKKIPENENDVKELVKDWFETHDGHSFPISNNGMGVHGLPDRVGCIPVVVTPEMVGKRIGVFVGLEAKAPGRRGQKLGGASQQQLGQLESILSAAGLAGLVDCQPDLDRMDAILSALTGGQGDAHVRALCNTLKLRTSGNG